MRHLLKQLKGDLPGMQEPIIEYKKAMEGREAKTAKVFEQKVDRNLKSIYENPTETKIENAIKEHSTSESEKVEAKKEANKAKKDSKQVETKATEIIKNGLAEGKSAAAITKDLLKLVGRQYFKDYKTKIGKAVAGAIIFSGLRKAIESQFGIKVPYSALALFLPLKKVRYGATAVGYLFEKIIKKGLDTHRQKEYKKFRLPSERRRYRAELAEKGISKKRIKEIAAR